MHCLGEFTFNIKMRNNKRRASQGFCSLLIILIVHGVIFVEINLEENAEKCQYERILLRY